MAFYAPLKSPDHPVPSGDRKMARMLAACLERAGCAVDLISSLRAYLPDPDDVAGWARLHDDAAAERKRIVALWPTAAPDLIFCYHPYYRAPDLIGFPLSRRFGRPYVTCEASYSSRRNHGIWTETQEIARLAVQDAALNLCLSGRDEDGLRAAIPGAHLARLPPFIDTAEFDRPPRPEPGHIVTVAMMRPGDKLESYRNLAAALMLLPDGADWRLSIAGDGPARAEVMALFASLPPERLHWHGALPAADVAALLARGSVLVWPGCGEAYGLVYLEAQAAGLPVVAYRIAGVPEVVSANAGGTLVEPGSAAALAAAVSTLLSDPARAARLGTLARTHVRAHHSSDAAAARLAKVMRTVLDRWSAR